MSDATGSYETTTAGLCMDYECPRTIEGFCKHDEPTAEEIAVDAAELAEVTRQTEVNAVARAQRITAATELVWCESTAPGHGGIGHSHPESDRCVHPHLTLRSAAAGRLPI